MANSTLDGYKKISSPFQYFNTGKARIVVKSQKPVDIFLTSNRNAENIRSTVDGESLSPIKFIYRNDLDQTISLPPDWIDGWQLIIGNPNAEQTAIYYEVYQV